MIVLTTTLQVECHSPLGLTVTVMVVMHVEAVYIFCNILQTILYSCCVESQTL